MEQKTVSELDSAYNQVYSQKKSRNASMGKSSTVKSISQKANKPLVLRKLEIRQSPNKSTISKSRVEHAYIYSKANNPNMISKDASKETLLLGKIIQLKKENTDLGLRLKEKTEKIDHLEGERKQEIGQVHKILEYLMSYISKYMTPEHINKLEEYLISCSKHIIPNNILPKPTTSRKVAIPPIIGLKGLSTAEKEITRTPQSPIIPEFKLKESRTPPIFPGRATPAPDEKNSEFNPLSYRAISPFLRSNLFKPNQTIAGSQTDRPRMSDGSGSGLNDINGDIQHKKDTDRELSFILEREKEVGKYKMQIEILSRRAKENKRKFDKLDGAHRESLLELMSINRYLRYVWGRSELGEEMSISNKGGWGRYFRDKGEVGEAHHLLLASSSTFPVPLPSYVKSLLLLKP